MNTEHEPLSFDISKPEQARCLAILVSELQSYAVKYRASKNANIIYIELI